MAIFEVKNLSKSFGGVRALRDVDIHFEYGKITGLIGPNGSGKSTLVNVLTGTLKPDVLTLSIRDTTVRQVISYEMRSYGITRTFQEVRLFNQMTVLDNLLLAVTERTVFSALAERHIRFHVAQVEEVLRRFELYDKRLVRASMLSYGQRKLLEIARALLTCAEIYFFDEPNAGLFPEMITRVSEALRDLKGKGAAVILIEHNMRLIRELCDYVYVFDGGRVLAHGEPTDVLRREDVLEAYLGT